MKRPTNSALSGETAVCHPMEWFRMALVTPMTSFCKISWHLIIIYQFGHLLFVFEKNFFFIFLFGMRKNVLSVGSGEKWCQRQK